MSSSYREREGPSLKILALAALGGIGLFGTDIFGTINRTIKEQLIEKPQADRATVKGSAVEQNRGSKTRLTKREINQKLQQVPVFVVVTKDKAIVTKDGIGYIFTTIEDANQYQSSLKDENVYVSATSLDDLYYPLIARQQKIGSYLHGLAQFANPNAEYQFMPSAREVKQTSTEWQAKHPHDIPLFRVMKLAFSKPEGLEIPLFLSRDDAINAYNRLQEEIKSTSTAAPANIQETSLLDILKLFTSGGFEGRSIEFYPSTSAIDDAKFIMLGSSK